MLQLFLIASYTAIDTARVVSWGATSRQAMIISSQTLMTTYACTSIFFGLILAFLFYGGFEGKQF
jgi:hypothetical protein